MIFELDASLGIWFGKQDIALASGWHGKHGVSDLVSMASRSIQGKGIDIDYRF